MKNVVHILVLTERVGEDALHWEAAMKNLQQTVQLLIGTARFPPSHSLIHVFA